MILTILDLTPRRVLCNAILVKFWLGEKDVWLCFLFNYILQNSEFYCHS